MKSQMWRLAGVSVLSLAMFANALADDERDARSVMGGGNGGSQRDQGRGNSGGGNQGGNNGGGGQSRPPQQEQPRQQQGPQGAARTLGGSNSSQRDDHNQGRPDNGQGGYGNGYNNGGSHNGGYNGGYNGGGNNHGGYNNGGYGQGGYNNGGHNGGRDDDDHRPSNNSGPQGPAKQLGGSSPRPPANQWQGGRPGGGWGPGPRWDPGYRVNTIPAGRWRVPYSGIDYYYADGYWYRPYGPSYIVVTPPYGVRVRTLPSYAEQLWIGSSLYFIAAGTYYLYEANRQEYVVASPPVQVTSNNGWQGNGYDVVAYPARGQSEAQVAQDRYDCHRWAVQQSGFDPSQANYAPAQNVADIYRRSLGACMAGRGYSVN